MKKLFTLLFTVLMISAYGQLETESYTALKVSADDAPNIDGALDPVWQKVEMVKIAKVPDNANITVPNPDSTDYYAEFGMLWDVNGLYVIFTVVDDNLVIEDDYYTDNSVAADMWWTDDNINILFSKDLTNTNFTQWEFAYQPGVDQEEKLSSDDWANPAKIDISLVKSAWYNDGNLWTLETFIDWKAFADGNATIEEEMDIFVEMRARDDDDDGTWESMYQWSTTNYNIESTGEGFGTVTLSSQEIVVEDVVLTGVDLLKNVNVYPNPTTDRANVQFALKDAGNVQIKLLDISGREIKTLLNEFRGEGLQQVSFNTLGLQNGMYIVTLKTADSSEKLFMVKR